MKKLILAAGLGLLTAAAFAQTATPVFDQRQANQGARIQQGAASGQLTQQEAARLEAGQDRLQRIEDRVKSDGVVTKQERARLQQAENVQSRHIYRQKHDRQHDFNRDGRIDRPARRK